MVKRPILYQLAKFREDRSVHCWDMAIFVIFEITSADILDCNGLSSVWGQYASSCQISAKSVKQLRRHGDLTFSKWRPSANLWTWSCCGLIWTTHLVVFSVVQNLAGIDVVVLIIIMHFSILSAIGLKNLIHAQKLSFGKSDPINGEWQQRDPRKPHHCARILRTGFPIHQMTCRSSKSVYRRQRSAIPRIKKESKKVKKSTKKPKHVTSHVRRDHPRCRSATWICVYGHTSDLVIYSRFHENPFSGFGITVGGGSKFTLSLYFGY